MPFKFLKAKYCLNRCASVGIGSISEEIRSFYAENVDKHKNLTYEERCGLQPTSKVSVI